MKKLSTVLFTTILTTTGFSPVQAQDDLIYVAVEPCRVADSRKSSEGVIKANTFRNFRVTGTSFELASQGGESDCNKPKSGQAPVAVAAYILAIPNDSSTGKGVLSAYPSGQSPPPVGSGSTVNFAKDQVIGNTTITTLCTSGCPDGRELAVLARNTDEDVVIDVQGYFYRANAIGMCANTDLEGNWQTFIAIPNLYASSCNIGVNSSGKVINGSCVSSEGNFSVTGGQLTITSGCEVGGSLVAGGDNSLIESARMSADRNLLTGIVTNGFGTTMFNAVRF
jgi:hypothetical protein